MATLGGSGVVPGATTATFNELNALTRRAYVPRVTVQIYFSGPTMMMLLQNAQKFAGGVNQISIPVQGQSMVQGAWAGYSGSFNKPQVIPGVQVAQFNGAYFLVPVPLVMGEILLQSTEAIVPILDVRMNDVYAVAAQQMSKAIFTNNTANALMPSSFVDAFDDGTNVASYGSINRNTGGNSFWQSKRINVAGSFTRQSFSNSIMQITDLAGGESPDFFVMSPGDFATLSGVITATENVYTDPGKAYTMDSPIRTAFPNIFVAGIPVYMDHWCPQGTAYAINTKYTAMYLSEDAPFVFSGFYSAIPVMQVAQVGVMIVGYQVITSKPISGATLFGITGNAF